MLLPRGVKKSDGSLDAYHRCLVTPGHRRRIEVTVTDMDGEILKHATSELGELLPGSEVDGDVERIPTRILTLYVLDRNQTLDLDRASLIEVVDARFVSGLGRWVDVEVITAKIQPESTRNGASVRLIAHGLEVQANGAIWKRRSFRKKTKKTWIIKELLRDAGESHFGGVPDRSRTTRRRIVVGHLASVWPKCRWLASSMNAVLFYNGRGRPVLRDRSQKPVLTIDGMPATAKRGRPFFPALLSDVEVGRDEEQGPNVFEVIGKDPKGPKKAPRAVVKLPPRHKNSPIRQARNGVPFRKVRSETREHAKTKDECRKIAKRWRRQAMRETRNFGFECMPIPHLEEYDTIRVRTRAGSYTVTVRQWVLPLDDQPTTMRIGSRKTREAR